MSNAWSWYVIALVVLNIAGCAWLLWWTARRRPGDPAPEQTSHIWDGDLTEYNKPLPRWWINLFFLTIVFGIGYLAWYGGLGGYQGLAKWSSAGEHARDKSRQDVKLAATFARYQGKQLPVLAQDPQALALGRSIFSNTCATCHGSSAQGANGYPNLADGIWHWGGSPEQILQTVEEGREGVMPEWGTVLTSMEGPDAAEYVVAYVRTLPHPEYLQNNYLAARGKKLFEGVCAACHGNNGKGNQELGAPDLTDDYWMYGDSKQSLLKTINEGRHGQMPAHRPLLGDTRTRLVAAYVWSLSNKPKAAATGKAQ